MNLKEFWKMRSKEKRKLCKLISMNQVAVKTKISMMKKKIKISNLSLDKIKFKKKGISFSGSKKISHILLTIQKLKF